MIPIYAVEKKDGLEQAIKDNLSIACHSLINLNPLSNVELANLDLIDNHPQFAKARENDQWDLFCFNSVLVSVGWNKNDDVFDPTELWLARKSPVFKKVNLEHDEKDIIGVITACLAVDFDSKILPDDSDEIPEKYDLVTSSVLYRNWDDEKLQERMDELIEAIGKNELFVSMEVLFTKFDYSLQDLQTGEASIVPRTHASAFLTKYLRVYGGSGEYQGKKVGRVPRNCTFSGQGIVKKPANTRSIIINSLASTSEKKMADTSDMISKADLIKAEAKIEKLQEQLQSVVAETQKSEREKLEKQIAKLNVDLEDVNKQVAAKAKELSDKETEVDNLNKQVKSKDVELAEAKTKLEKMEKAQKKSDRVNKLIVAGLDEAKAGQIADKWETVNDEQFNDIVEMNKVPVTKTEASTKETPKTEQAVAATLTEESVEKEAALNVKPDAQTESVQKSTAAWVAGFLGKNNDQLTKK
jgi:Spy/CpxP family protein refolding chaperone